MLSTSGQIPMMRLNRNPSKTVSGAPFVDSLLEGIDLGSILTYFDGQVWWSLTSKALQQDSRKAGQQVWTNPLKSLDSIWHVQQLGIVFQHTDMETFFFIPLSLRDLVDSKALCVQLLLWNDIKGPLPPTFWTGPEWKWSLYLCGIFQAVVWSTVWSESSIGINRYAAGNNSEWSRESWYKWMQSLSRHIQGEHSIAIEHICLFLDLLASAVILLVAIDENPRIEEQNLVWSLSTFGPGSSTSRRHGSLDSNLRRSL